MGSKGLASYLVTTPQGHILINSNLQESVPQIRASVEQLGLSFTDIRILLISHAHWDHNAGSAEIKRLTGARYMAAEGDVPTIEGGGRSGDNDFNDTGNTYPPTKVDRVLRDGDEVRLGDAVLTARITPGHTYGCTTWTLKVRDGDKVYNAVIIGSPNVNPGYKLVGSTAYPRIAEDFERTFDVLKSLPVDLFLGAHGSYFNLEAKVARLSVGGANPFVDRQGYAAYVPDRERAFRTEFRRQRSGR